MARCLPPKEMWEMFDASVSGRCRAGLPGEVTGRLRPWKSWRPIEQATMSYGHGISCQPDPTGARLYRFCPRRRPGPLSLGPTKRRTGGSPVFAADGARSAGHAGNGRQPEGTAPKARVPGYRVGGKTGYRVQARRRRYAKKYVASFVGFAPISPTRA
jgi:cell division protein FtsI (penicillin-binding protein 3)